MSGGKDEDRSAEMEQQVAHAEKIVSKRAIGVFLMQKGTRTNNLSATTLFKVTSI
jgi:hypothetical protein